MRRFSVLTLLVALLIVGCTEVTIEQSNPLTEINSLPDLTASFADEGETRTFVEDSKYLRWHESDLITAFFGNTLNRQYKFKGKTGDNSGTFSLVPSGELGTGNDLSSIYAAYPHDENTTITDNGVISLTLPATQTYAENSFGKGANTMVAVTESVEDTFLSFKNACGYLKLKLYGDNVTIASIEVKGNNEEKIAGSATATMEFGGVPTIAMNDEATTSVTLDCGEGVSIGATADMATEFWIVLPETTFEGGITITATNTVGAVFSKSTTNTVAITRNDIQPMVALKAEFATAKPANNEIWYTNGSTTEATAPYKTDVFGANIVSNTYDADKGCWIIEFDGEVSKIGSYAFNRCSAITNIAIPDSVTSIDTGAFCNCSSITSITIPNSVTSIGTEAFYNTGITSITIPDSVNSIGYGVFSSCLYLEKFEGKFASNDGYCLIVDGGLRSFAIGCDITEYNVPDGVTSIGSSAFKGCTNLISVTIPQGAHSIDDSAFSGCKSLKSVTIPRSFSASSIGRSAFYGCTSLTEIYCNAYDVSIEENLFDYHASDFKIYVPSDSFIPYRMAEYWVNYTDYIVGYNFDTGEVVDIPTKPANNEIWYCAKTSIKPNLAAPIIEFNMDLGCYVATFSVAVQEIEDNAFSNISGELTGVILPDCVTSIGENAFAGCTSLISIVIPDSVTKLGNNVFSGCSKLSSVTLSKNLTSIPSAAFYRCTNIRVITIPEGITYIGSAAFAYSLNAVTLPSSIEYIGDGAFAGITFVDCSAVTTPPTIESQTFATNASLIIVVPAESLNAYKSAWGQYVAYIRS